MVLDVSSAIGSCRLQLWPYFVGELRHPSSTVRVRTRDFEAPRGFFSLVSSWSPRGVLVVVVVKWGVCSFCSSARTCLQATYHRPMSGTYNLQTCRCVASAHGTFSKPSQSPAKPLQNLQALYGAPNAERLFRTCEVRTRSTSGCREVRVLAVKRF